MINGVIAGRYRIERLLGEGGMSRVYEATDLRLERSVAVKTLREQFADDSEFVERFAREARTAASLSHPGVINIFDVGQDGEASFIVMELVDGRPLREYIDSDAPFPLRDVVTVLDQLWGIHTSPLFAASVELSVAARTDPELRVRLQEIDREVTANVAAGVGELFPDLASNRRFREAIDAALAVMRGLSLLEFVEEDSGQRRWPAARRMLLEGLERIAQDS